MNAEKRIALPDSALEPEEGISGPIVFEIAANTLRVAVNRLESTARLLKDDWLLVIILPSLPSLFSFLCSSRLHNSPISAKAAATMIEDRVIPLAPATRDGRGQHLFSLSWWRGRLLGLSRREASFAVRGFRTPGDEARRLLEAAGEAFIEGFNAALAAKSVQALRGQVDAAPAPLRGFVAEGAAMGVAIVDAVSPRPPRLAAHLELCRDDFDYLTHVGAGWALARVPWRRGVILRTLDPIHGWLAYDGLGFHDAYFAPRRALSGWKRERRGYAARAYDQGVGRALWFICGAEIEQAVRAITALGSGRSADLWSGIGLAMSYAGGSDPGQSAEARDAAGALSPMLAQGAAFAAEARAQAGHVPAHTAETLRSLADLPVERAVGLVRQARRDAESAPPSGIPRYELWRCLVQQALGDRP